MDQSIGFRPLTPERWDDLERLFGPERGAYPLDPASGARPSGAFTGIARAFRDQGFVEVARRSATRPILRRELGRADRLAMR